MNKNQINHIILHVLIILYLVVGFVPSFSAVDRVAPQFLYLGILNLLTVIYLFSTIGIIQIFKGTFKKNLIVYLLFLFWGWGLTSLFYALNKEEAIIESSRIFIYVYSFINLLILLKWTKIDLNKILLVFSLIHSVEVLTVLSKFYELYLSNYNSSVILGRNLELRTFTGNINITAFTMALKVPFLIFFLIKRKSINIILKVAILAVSFFTIFILGSRGANLTLGLIVISFLIVFALSKIINKKNVILVLGAFLLGISLNLLFFRKDDNLNYIARTSNIFDTSSQKRILFYKHALQSILNKPFLGIGLGNWKIFSITAESVEYDDYQIPYHVHNDFLEVAAELGIIGMTLFYGIYIYLFLMFIKFFRRPKIPEGEKILGIAFAMGLFTYLADSFLNFPFTRPVMQLPNLFLIGSSTLLMKKNGIESFGKLKMKFNDNLKILYLIFSILGLIYSIYISYRVYRSYEQQNFLILMTRDLNSKYTAEEVYSINSRIPNVSVHTIPIDAMKATLLIRLEENDSVLKFAENGLKANPYVGYPEVVKSIYFFNSGEMDSTLFYAKKAYQIYPNHYDHFDHYINLIEYKKDTLELKVLYDHLKNNYSEKKYTKYLQVSSRMKNNLSLTDKDLIEKISVNNPLNSINKAFNVMGQIGRENVIKGLILSNNAERYYNKKDYVSSAKLFLSASQYNPLEVAYLENAANSYMKANENKKAITILEKILTELNPKTGKSEYVLGIIYLDLDQSKLGCDYLFKAKSKGFKFPDRILNQFCEEKQN